MGTEFFRTSEDDTVILSADKGRVWINRNGVQLGSAMKGKQLAQLFNKYQIANWMQSSSIDFAHEYGFDKPDGAKELIRKAVYMLKVSYEIVGNEPDWLKYN
jgi:hypothetical protein|tara:strand:+ start:66 stop:371 length:306 start_codon:yes stop_codon:yes gene_type:complete